VPWEFNPLQHSSGARSGSLAMGNACVLKPRGRGLPDSPRIRDLALKAGFPPGAAEPSCRGLAKKRGLRCHPSGVDHLSSQAPSGLARWSQAAAAPNIVPVTQKLAASPAGWFFDDADLSGSAVFGYAGIQTQAKHARPSSRILVQAAASYNQVRDRMPRRIVATVRSALADARRPLISARQKQVRLKL